MSRRHPPLLALSIAVLALAALALSPAVALAAKPTRSVLGPGAAFTIPAGQACAFDLHVAPGDDNRRTVTEFDDGRVVTNTNGTAVLTNVDSGATFIHKARYHVTETFDAATNDVRSVTDGQINFWFFPGDQGPYGEVASPGAFYRFTGHVEATFDLDTFTITAFTYRGKVQDVCAALS